MRSLLISMVAFCMVVNAAEVKFITEYRYPTSYDVVPITRTDRNGNVIIVGGMVTPRDFVTREVGVIMQVDASIINLACIDVVVHTLGNSVVNGNTPLMLAAAAGDIYRVKELLIKGAFVNASNVHGSTALMGASAGGHTEIVRMLIEKGAFVNARSKKGYTALMFAAKNGHYDTVKLLLDNGASIDAMDNNGLTALMYASAEGHRDIVEFLLKRGANPFLKDKNGADALTFASLRKHEDVLKVLHNLVQ